MKKPLQPDKPATQESTIANQSEDLPDSKHPENELMSADDRANQRAGSAMIIGVWVVMLGMLTWFAHQWFERAANPNRNPELSVVDGQSSIELRANRNGHYIATGSINGEDVVFLLDTGATSVSVPIAIARKIGLTGEHPQQVRTANGTITVEATLLDSVSLGGLTLERVRGHINPGMQGDEVLLGMSFLRYFDLRTSNSKLTISTP